MLLTISGLTFEVSSPFQPGHVLTAGEAEALNTYRGVKIRENLQRAIAKIALSGAGLASIQSEVLRYDSQFSFEGPHQHGMGGRFDGLLREVALDFAKRAHPNFTDEQLAEEASSLLVHPAVHSEARKRWAESRAVGLMTLAELTSEEAQNG